MFEKRIYSSIIIVSFIALIFPVLRMLIKDKNTEEVELVESLLMANLFFSNKIVDFGMVPNDTILKAHYMLYNVSKDFCNKNSYDSKLHFERINLSKLGGWGLQKRRCP